MLVFGEDQNDRQAICELISALAPDLDATPEPRRHPLVLIKDAPLDQVSERARRVADVVNAERAIADITCVFAHEDCDAVEPAHEAVCDRIEEALARAGCEAHAVVPAWELEAWWFLWPEAVNAVNRSWASLDPYRGRAVGMIQNAKEELQAALRRGFSRAQRNRIRTYQESDAPAIAREVRLRGDANRLAATSQSYDRFRASVAACAERQISEAVGGVDAA